MRKKHENPEFQVINMEQANAKFYAASQMEGGGGGSDGMKATGFDDNSGNNDIWN